MSVYAQVDPNSNIENTISQTKSAENLPTPVLQEKEIEVSNGTGYSLNNIQGAELILLFHFYMYPAFSFFDLLTRFQRIVQKISKK